MPRRKQSKQTSAGRFRGSSEQDKPAIQISKRLRDRLKRLKKSVHRTLVWTRKQGEILAQPLDLGD